MSRLYSEMELFLLHEKHYRLQYNFILVFESKCDIFCFFPFKIVVELCCIIYDFFDLVGWLVAARSLY